MHAPGWTKSPGYSGLDKVSEFFSGLGKVAGHSGLGEVSGLFVNGVGSGMPGVDDGQDSVSIPCAGDAAKIEAEWGSSVRETPGAIPESGPLRELRQS